MNQSVFHRFQGCSDLPENLRGCSVAIGNFDGVHRGHQEVLSRALDYGRELGLPAVVLTFEPHPKTVFDPQNPVFRLTAAPFKARLLDMMEFSAVVEIPFTREFASNSAADFVSHILHECLGVRQVVTGFNFHFGKARQGTPEFLRQAGARLGFGVSEVEPFRDESGEVVSSSRIRRYLAEGAVAEAAGLLGYRYTVEETVIPGKQLGRELSFPTANMRLPDNTDLKPGIYAVRFREQSGIVHDGVASYGRRPTVDEDGALLLETFIFDYDGDLYGQDCVVSLIAFLREEMKFDDLDALKVQMDRDCEEARAVLASLKPISALDQALLFG